MKIYGLRIDYSITAKTEPDGDFEEVGFGGTSECTSLVECAHEIASNLQNDIWESTGDNVDPLELLAALHELMGGMSNE